MIKTLHADVLNKVFKKGFYPNNTNQKSLTYATCRFSSVLAQQLIMSKHKYIAQQISAKSILHNVNN